MLAWASRWRPRLARLSRALVRGAPASAGFGRQASALAAWGLVWLVGQESLEHSIALGRPAGPELTPTGSLMALVGLGVCALLVVLIASVCVTATRSALARHSARPPRFGPQPRQATPSAPAIRRRAPLSERRGLRAPPLPIG